MDGEVRAGASNTASVLRSRLCRNEILDLPTLASRPGAESLNRAQFMWACGPAPMSNQDMAKSSAQSRNAAESLVAAPGRPARVPSASQQSASVDSAPAVPRVDVAPALSAYPARAPGAARAEADRAATVGRLDRREHVLSSQAYSLTTPRTRRTTTTITITPMMPMPPLLVFISTSPVSTQPGHSAVGVAIPADSRGRSSDRHRRHGPLCRRDTTASLHRVIGAVPHAAARRIRGVADERSGAVSQ